jgi:hypothetical protein
MNSLSSQPASIVRTHSTCVWLQTDSSGLQWKARVHVRGVQGLWYLASTYRGARPTSEFLYFDTYQRGIFSARPFLPGSPCDDSTELCVIALIRDICRERGVDAADLIQRGDPSRPRYSREDFIEAKHQADWEGTVFPVIWNPSITTALCLTLEDPRWGDLARLIRDLKT